MGLPGCAPSEAQNTVPSVLMMLPVMRSICEGAVLATFDGYAGFLAHLTLIQPKIGSRCDDELGSGGFGNPPKTMQSASNASLHANLSTCRVLAHIVLFEGKNVARHGVTVA